MELEKSEQFLLQNFELFKVIESIIENGKICINELDRLREREKFKDIYPKGISTLRRKLNKMVECKYLRKESAREHEKNKAHFVYCCTENLKKSMILLHNRLSALIHTSFEIDEIENLDVKLLDDLISRGQLFEMQKSARALGSNLS